MSPPFQGALDPVLTGCLPPGDYRYHVEYGRLGGDDEDVIDGKAIDFVITPFSAPTPMPTNRPAPPSPAAAPTAVAAQTSPGQSAARPLP
jgi:hypothetical protein